MSVVGAILMSIDMDGTRNMIYIHLFTLYGDDVFGSCSVSYVFLALPIPLMQVITMLANIS